MTHNDQFIARLEAYLDEYEGVTPLPDAVRNAVRAELPKTKQIGPVAGLSRFLSMTMHIPTTARYGLAAAAVVAAVLIGASFLGGGSVGGPDRSPPPQASPSVAPTAGGPISLLDASPSDNLAAGAYYLDLPVFPARIDITMPSGWWHFYDRPLREDSSAHALLVDSLDTGAANGSAWGVGFTVARSVRVNPCDSAEGVMDSSVTASAEALAEAVAAWNAFPVIGVEDVTISGFSGKRVELTRDEESACDAPVLFTTPSGFGFAPQFPSSEPAVNQFTFLDVEGSVLVIWTTDFAATTQFEVDGGASPDPEAHVSHQAELHHILDSIVITPR